MLGSRRNQERALLASTWTFLEDAEREFAAALYPVVGAPLRAYVDEPPPYRCRLSVLACVGAHDRRQGRDQLDDEGNSVFVVGKPTL